jgi:hypothetical protein
VLERRLAEAITATAGVIIGAVGTGRPALTLERVRPVQKVKKP